MLDLSLNSCFQYFIIPFAQAFPNFSKVKSQACACQGTNDEAITSDSVRRGMSSVICIFKSTFRFFFSSEKIQKHTAHFRFLEKNISPKLNSDYFNRGATNSLGSSSPSLIGVLNCLSWHSSLWQFAEAYRSFHKIAFLNVKIKQVRLKRKTLYWNVVVKTLYEANIYYGNM